MDITTSFWFGKATSNLQLYIRAEGEQTIKPSIIFRGQGNVQLLEKSMYDERVDVYFQKAGWIDEEVNIEMGQQHLGPRYGEKRRRENHVCR